MIDAPPYPTMTIPPPPVRWFLKLALLLISIGVIGSTLAACGANARQAELRATMMGLNAASDALVRLDARHQDELVRAATSLEDGVAKLTAYKAARDRLLDLFAAAYHAIATAAVLQPTTSQVAAAVDSARQAMEAWDEFRRWLGPGGRP